MNASTVYLFTGFIAITIAVLCWFVFRIITAVPDESREYLDTPPAFFKLLWYPIRLIGFYIEPFMGSKFIEKYRLYISFAGYDYVFKPVNLVASQIVFSIFFAVFLDICLTIAGITPFFAIFGAVYGFIYPIIWLKGQKTKRLRKFLKELPFFLDIITLCVEAGLTLNGALQQAASKGPYGPVRSELERVIRDIRSGMTRTEALRLISKRIDESSVNNLVSSIIQAENMGMSLGPILRLQSEQKRVERFLRAEKLAMEAPVKMLLPLVACIFPCTFIVIGFPIYVLMVDAFK